MQKKEIINSIKIIVLALILTGAISYAWTGPAEDPPAGNVLPPLNIGASNQDKEGILTLGGLLVAGGAYFNSDVFIASGNPSAGDVLTAVDNTGLVEWESPVGGGGEVNGGGFIDYGITDPFGICSVAKAGATELPNVNTEFPYDLQVWGSAVTTLVSANRQKVSCSGGTQMRVLSCDTVDEVGNTHATVTFLCL